LNNKIQDIYGGKGEKKVILAVAGVSRRDNVVYTEKAIREAAKMHKELSVETTDQGLALIWKGHIPNKKESKSNCIDDESLPFKFL